MFSYEADLFASFGTPRKLRGIKYLANKRFRPKMSAQSLIRRIDRGVQNDTDLSNLGVELL